ncbi:transmembrane protein 217-like isoform X2 [Narcine bancroftii]|uniref:transmembrane protein 217-like isoform X2 n=1 Tax=Narcine bancroftii TaxID=1343680 RepID=UPI0038311118
MNIHNFWSGCRRALVGNICGLSAKEGTIVSGLFMLVSSILQIIFESGNLHHYSLIVNLNESDTKANESPHQFHVHCIASITLLVAGIIAVCVLFLSVWKKIFWGVGGYIIWIFLYEFGHIFLFIFSIPEYTDLLKTIYALECSGMVLRIIAQTYWLFFLIRHTVELYHFSRRAKELSKAKQKSPQKLKFGKVVEMRV